MSPAALHSAALITVLLGSVACGQGPELVVAFDPTTAEAQLPAVVTALRAGDPVAALAAWDAAQAEERLPPGALHYRALALADAGRADEALAVWQQELERHPGNGRAHVFVADLHMDQGRLDDAAEHLDLARRYDQGFARHALVAGRLALLRNEDERASRHFRDFLQSDPWGPSSSEAHHALGQVAARRGDPAASLHDQASQYLEQLHRALAYSRAVLADYPDDVMERFRVGAAYLNLYQQASGSPIFGPVAPVRRRELLDQAEAGMRAVLAIDPGFARAVFNLGNIRRLQNRLPEAADFYHQTLELDPAHLDARLNLVRMLRLTSDEIGAHEQLLLAFEHGSDRDALAPALLMLADVEERFGDLESAIQRLELLLEWFPDDPAGITPRIERMRDSLDADG